MISWIKRNHSRSIRIINSIHFEKDNDDVANLKNKIILELILHVCKICKYNPILYQNNKTL